MNTIWLVLTTVNRPGKAVLAYATMAIERGWGMVVVGDTKTPPDWAVPGVTYLSVDAQNDLFGRISNAIPTRHYSRKNLGYLYAMKNGAQVILETDDDNSPYPEFGQILDSDVEGRKVGGSDWVNVYRHFTDRLIWPRGLPLDRIHEAGETRGTATAQCPIQQGLADADPDVDAIYRLLYKDPLYFDRKCGVVILERGTYCPFNSQNTVHFPQAFDLLYLPCHVSFRMTDIWRSLVAQRILWSRGAALSFHPPTAHQERNEHDLMRDFKDEVDGYLGNREMGRLLNGIDLEGANRERPLFTCYKSLEKAGFIQPQEMEIVALWEKAMEGVGG